MSLTVIDINDYSLTFIQGGAVYTEIAAAIVTKESIDFGLKAWQQRAIVPSNCYYHYWHQLGYEPVSSPNNEVNHHADLAYLQLSKALSHLNDCDEVIFAVSAHYTKEQLSLLLGIAKSCELTVLAFINKSTLYMVNQGKLGTNLVLDIGLHHASITTLAISDNVDISAYHSYSDKGYFELIKFVASWINSQFINEFRFDAFQIAETEQMLLDQSSSIIQDDDNYTVTIATQDNRVTEKSVVIRPDDIKERIALFFAPVFQALPEQGNIFLSPHFSDVLPETLVGRHWRILDKKAIYQLDNELIKQFKDNSSVALHTQLNIVHSPLQTAIASRNQSLAATHIVNNGIASPLTEGQIMLCSLKNDSKAQVMLIQDNGYWFLHANQATSVRVNNHPIKNKQLITIGDLIELEGQAYMLIYMEPKDD